MAAGGPWLKPVVKEGDPAHITLVVEVSHGVDVLMTFEQGWLEDYVFETEYSNIPHGGQTVKIVVTANTVNGDQFRFGAMTLVEHPWVRSMMGGKGFGRARDDPDL